MECGQKWYALHPGVAHKTLPHTILILYPLLSEHPREGFKAPEKGRVIRENVYGP
jgi:hypothetical protein